MYYKLNRNKHKSGIGYSSDVIESLNTNIGDIDVREVFMHYINYNKASKSEYNFYPLKLKKKSAILDYYTSFLPARITSIMNRKFLDLIEQYNLPSHSVYDILIDRDGELMDEYYLFKIDQSIAGWINYNKSIFYFRDGAKEATPLYKPNGPLKNNIMYPHYDIKKQLYGTNFSFPQGLKTNRLVLDNSFELDYFSITGLTGLVVSQKLKNAMEEAEITGVSFEPWPELIIDDGKKVYDVKLIDKIIPTIETKPDLSHPAVQEMVDWIKSPLEFGQEPDGLVILDDRDLLWPTQEIKRCYLMAYTVNGDNFIGFAGPTEWTFLNIDYSKLSIEELYLRYVGWYIATFSPRLDGDKSIATDPDLLDFIKHLKTEGYTNMLCTQRKNLNGNVYYEIRGKDGAKDVYIVGTADNFERTSENVVLPFYDKIGRDWDPFDLKRTQNS